MQLSSLLFANAIDKFEPIAKWTTVVLLAIALLIGALVFFLKRTSFSKYAKITVFAFAGYLLVLAVVFFVLDAAHHYEGTTLNDDLVRFILIPIAVFCTTALVSLPVYAYIEKHKPNRKKAVAVTLICVCATALISALVCLAIYYARNIQNDGYYNSESATVQQLALYIGAIVSVALILALTAFDKRELRFNSRTLAYAGICVSMSYALSYIKLWDMPQGGSVTLVSLLPIMLFSYAFGVKRGVFVGFAYGTLQALQDPWLIHPAQFLLDYPAAFAACGLAGLFKDVKLFEKRPPLCFGIGAALAGTLRFVCHVLSGVFAFEAYAEGQNAWLYSLAYNSYVFVDAALVIVASVFALSSRALVKTLEKSAA